jgi:hypothetical protein
MIEWLNFVTVILCLGLRPVAVRHACIQVMYCTVLDQHLPIIVPNTMEVFVCFVYVWFALHSVSRITDPVKLKQKR